MSLPLEPDNTPPSRPHLRVVGGLVWREDKVLLARRGPGRAMEGLWEFPGGKVGPDETDQAALARELLEELHLPVVVGEPFHQAEHDYPTFTIRLVLYHAHPHGAEPVLTEHDALAWVAPQDVASYALTPADCPGALALREAPLRAAPSHPR